jgi:hypothetical protein
MESELALESRRTDMILRTLYLQNLDPRIESYDFLKESRHICNYLERGVLKAIKYKADFGRICISLTEADPPTTVLNSSNVLCVGMPFDLDEYESFSRKERSQYYSLKLKQGLEKCNCTHSIPLSEILQGLKDHQDLGWHNEWVHRKRHFRERKVVASLTCNLTIDSFELTLQVWRDGSLVYNKVVLETDPDEIAFGYRFKDIELKRGRLIVTSKVSDPLLSLSMRDLNG